MTGPDHQTLTSFDFSLHQALAEDGSIELVINQGGEEGGLGEAVAVGIILTKSALQITKEGR